MLNVIVMKHRMLSTIKKIVIMLIVVKLCAVMRRLMFSAIKIFVIMLSVIMLTVACRHHAGC